jgi:SOS-response transcriptional repressor LexA
MNYAFHIEKLKKGEITSFRPKGNSMQGKIESGQLVTVSPKTEDIEEGDVVFCKVRGTYYVHLVKSIKIEGDDKFYLIANNKGHINGWVGSSNIFGRVTEVSD